MSPVVVLASWLQLACFLARLARLMLILRESPTIFLLSVVRLDCLDIVDTVTGLHRWQPDINPLFI